jgi:hypothetical protein
VVKNFGTALGHSNYRPIQQKKRGREEYTEDINQVGTAHGAQCAQSNKRMRTEDRSRAPIKLAN